MIEINFVEDGRTAKRLNKRRRVADTSRESYDEVKLTLTGRQLMVLRALGAYRERLKDDPTAYELLHWMQKWRAELDLNDVRPRLTEMKDDDLVMTNGKRLCNVTARRVYVWAETERGTRTLAGYGPPQRTVIPTTNSAQGAQAV